MHSNVSHLHSSLAVLGKTRDNASCGDVGTKIMIRCACPVIKLTTIEMIITSILHQNKGAKTYEVFLLYNYDKWQK